LNYALEWKWKVFPCLPGTKLPLAKNSFYDATTDPDQIDLWWTEHPEANIAACPEDQGLCVIETDDYKPDFDQAVLDALNLPDTFEVQSARDGVHRYFKGSLPPTQGRLGKGIDTRGQTSYMLLPPSVFEGKAYSIKSPRDFAPIPPEIAGRLEAAKPPAIRQSDVELDLPVNIDRARASLRVRVKNGEVAIAGREGDNTTYRTATAIFDFGLSPKKVFELLWSEWNPHCEPSWSEDEWQLRIEHAESYRQNENPHALKGAPSETFKDYVAAKLKDAEAKEPAPEKRFLPPDRTFSELLTCTPEPVNELIPGLIEKGIATMLAGPGGVHKSRGMSLQSGADIFGRKTEQATFVYLSYEDREPEVIRRAQRINKKLGLPAKNQGRYKDFTALQDDDEDAPAAVTINADGVTRGPLYYELRDYLRAIPGHKFVAVDSTYNFLCFTGATKIDETLVKKALYLLDRLCAETNSTLVYLWHPSQAGQERGNASGWSVAWENAPRARFVPLQGQACQQAR